MIRSQRVSLRSRHPAPKDASTGVASACWGVRRRVHRTGGQLFHGRVSRPKPHVPQWFRRALSVDARWSVVETREISTRLVARMPPSEVRGRCPKSISSNFIALMNPSTREGTAEATPDGTASASFP